MVSKILCRAEKPTKRTGNVDDRGPIAGAWDWSYFPKFVRFRGLRIEADTDFDTSVVEAI